MLPVLPVVHSYDHQRPRLSAAVRFAAGLAHFDEHLSSMAIGRKLASAYRELISGRDRAAQYSAALTHE